MLVFDDLERSNISTTDLLGCINEYCENQNFKTIIIANEDRITDNSENNLKYSEIKEKIVQRTVYYIPNYDKILEEVISEMTFESEYYREFLRKNIGCISTFFSEANNLPLSNNTQKFSIQDETTEQIEKLYSKSRSHNIRSMKCALQDFERVYKILEDKSVEHIEAFLFAFIAYLMVFRAGISKTVGNDIDENSVKKVYFGLFNEQYVLKSIIVWLQTGEWNPCVIEQEIDYIIEKERARTPAEILRKCLIIYIDDGIVEQGFSDVLKDAYDGKLSFDEYITFIKNAYFIRKFNIRVEKIDWIKVQSGIKICKDIAVHQEMSEQIFSSMISEDEKINYTSEEWETYNMIWNMHFKSEFVLAQNENLYIESMKDYSGISFIKLRNKRFSVFNQEMAEVTATAFENIHNNEKLNFTSNFYSMWEYYAKSPDINIGETVKGFKSLEMLLSNSYSKYKEKNHTISAYHTQLFIKKINELIDMAE